MNAQLVQLLPRSSYGASRALTYYPRAELARLYATQTNTGHGPRTTRKRHITVLSDDGQLAWGELTGREKFSRATQQSFNFVIVLAGVVLTGGVGMLLWQEVISPNSKTWQFEKAVERIKDDTRCTRLLGDRREIKAYGQQSSTRWAHNRPIATTVEKDRLGREHMRMNFHVEGPRSSGTVHVHMIKPLDENSWEYQLLALDVPGHSRIILEKAPEKPSVASSLKLFGIKWR
ncbi:TIM21-domain-containing protein [Penicillium capsulatum]|uniref:Mitochondrial import inner membrane translocase subunit Tim21 n=1 Tax=Penicillium capsulatum TaxID=69766 RepID=A0A9W9I8U9_9EURO|nr:TIM21-domain-containing protein [Penicillium capsulatum]KAJ6135757.1 TIM21-domain-containing protein [Penicillium capsulatum]